MEKELLTIRDTAQKRIESAQNSGEIETVRLEYLGRKGALTAVLRSLKDLPPEKRKKIGQEANQLRLELERQIEEKKRELQKTEFESVLKKEWLDVTRPGIKPEKGHLHPITKIIREINSIFTAMGFAVVEGPEVETEYYNFDALNIPADHPARDMWDTFWLKPESRIGADLRNADTRGKSSKLLLRTHTSPVQIRYMETHNPPLKIIVPGRVYRYEATDASHDIQFYQLEGLMVDKNISVANFKAIIREFFSQLFKTKIEVRLRPSYFPFTEPSFEVDVSCVICNAEGCSVCKGGGWLELAGAGMVHPYVFKAAGYNPKNWQGFAFGMGISRLAMMKYKIPDIRLFHSGDLKFLKQF